MKKITALLLSAALLCPTLALAEDTVKIGIFEPMTGATAAGGSMEKEGFDLANELYPDVLGQENGGGGAHGGEHDDDHVHHLVTVADGGHGGGAEVGDHELVHIAHQKL